MLHLVLHLVLLPVAAPRIVSVTQPSTASEVVAEAIPSVDLELIQSFSDKEKEAASPKPGKEQESSLPTEKSEESPSSGTEQTEPTSEEAGEAAPSESETKPEEEGKEEDAAEPESQTSGPKALLLRPLTQLSGLAEADTPVKPVLVLGEEIRTIDARNLTVDVLDIMLGPIREANLLLPKRLDPFSTDEPQPLLPRLRDVKRNEFKPSEQRRLLGSQLATRDDTPDSTAKWRWSVTAGGAFRQGNTSNTNIHSQFQANRSSNKSMLTMRTGVNYNRNGDNDPNRRATGELIIDRNMRGRWIWYGREDAEYDQARLIDLRNVASTGLGFKFIDELDRRLVARTGPTISHMIYAGDADNPDETRSGWLLESEYRHLIGETVRIEWTTSAFPNFDSEQQFRIRSDAALLFPIGTSSAWSWKLGLRHDYQLDPIGTTRSTDLEGYFSITYSK